MNTNKEQNNLPQKIQNSDKDKIKTFDVRPIIDSGKDPFTDIMSFIKELKDDDVLLLINSFEPLPLYNVMGNKGYEHYTEKNENTFQVYFYKSVSETESASSKNYKLNENKIHKDITNVIEIDVRDLEPPEPMVKILEMLSQVDDESLLLVHHHREPMMLFPKLEERGFEAVSNKIDENYYKVVITKKRN